MKSSHSFVTKMKLFKWYVPEALKRTEVSWMLLRETGVWKGGDHSDCGLRDCNTVYFGWRLWKSLIILGGNRLLQICIYIYY